MKSKLKSKSTEQKDITNAIQPSLSFDSNAEMIARMEQSVGNSEQAKTLDVPFGFLKDDQYDAAKSMAHEIANEARTTGDLKTAEHAGLLWQIAESLAKYNMSMESSRYSEAQTHAHSAANNTRTLKSQQVVSGDDAQDVIEAAGGFWTLANNKAAESKQAATAPMIDQHELDHGRNWAFCGIATMLMMLKANNIEASTDNASLNGYANKMYIKGHGTSGAHMASYIRERGLTDSTYTTTGRTSRLVSALDKGQPVPFGVVKSKGIVSKLDGGGSSRYPMLKVGDFHDKPFKGSGHWVLVTRYEGKADNPSAFYFNDPDVGGELKATRAQLVEMGNGDGNFWMVHQ